MASKGEAKIDETSDLIDIVPVALSHDKVFDLKSTSHQASRSSAELDVKDQKPNVVADEKLADEQLSPNDDDNDDKSDRQYGNNDRIIKTGRDVSDYLLSDRDDGDAALTFRAIFLGSAAAAFQATMHQLYMFKPTSIELSGVFLVVITYCLGWLWHIALPTAKTLRAKWGDEPKRRSQRWTVSIVHFINPGPFSIKEHAVAAITSNTASNGSEALWPFTVQKLFYNQPLTPGLVVMGVLSISLFGYGLTGLLRPITVYPSSMVYWGNLPLVQLFQKLHWDSITQSKPLRWFWYAFFAMVLYEIFPAYIFLTLVAFSIPCLASMHAPASRQQLLTNLFGGAQSNEGLGLFSICLDWQFITASQVSLPLVQQANSWIGLIICYVAFLALYYGNAWNARDLPFLSTQLLTPEGDLYPVSKVFINGILDESALQRYGLPRLTATYTYAMICGNVAIGALIAHVLIFWRAEAVQAVREAFTKQFNDRHQRAMQKYKEVSWLYYAFLLVFAFALGAAVNATQNTTLSVGHMVVALVIGSCISPFSTLLYGRFGTGVATNQLMKMIAGVISPGRPIANLYFTAWAHSTVAQSLNLAADLKMGTYLKIPPFVMFFTQIWGTVLGCFLNYAVMISVVNNQHDVLLSTHGSGVWTGSYFQSLNTQASVWALSKHLYAVGKPYFIVPMGIVIGVALVLVHAAVVYVKPKVGSFKLRSLNMPTIALYAGWLGFNQTQSCVIFSTIALGVFVQFYLRTYKPKVFQRYAYVVAAGLDGGMLLVVFILSFAVYGAAGVPHPFPTWAGNPDGYADHCPNPSA